MGKKYVVFIFILLEALLSFEVIAGNNDSALKPKVTQWLGNASEIRFLENKGQMMDMQRKAVKNILFRSGAGGVDVYVTTSGLSYVFAKIDRHKYAGTSARTNQTALRHKGNDSIAMQYCRADMQLTGADIRKENIVKEDESGNRTDYYYGDICPNGILNVHSYGKVTIKNIYPGIDWVLHGGKNGLKYDFIVHPGADPSQIKLKYKWTDKPQLQTDGSVKISTPMGNITEGRPVSYCNGEQVLSTYMIKDSEIHFNVSNYNSTQPLVIDPVLVWGTYYGDGSPSLNEVESMQEDGNSVWITGQTGSPNFPTLNPGGGAYFQGTFPGDATLYLLQFSTAGVLKWATYYGGSGGDVSTSIYSDKRNVWVTGYTESSDFPLFNPGGGAYFQPSKGGNLAVFILQFDVTGVRKWATYYSGNSEEYGNSIQSDGTHVWLTGETYSSNLPTLNPGGGAYFQPALAGGANVFIAEFNTTGVLQWATYYGGNSLQYQEGGNSIYSDGENVWLTGFTSSTNFPTLNPGGGAYFQAGMTGASNSFIVKFNTAGMRKWATYYGGSGSDVGNSIYSNGGKIWVTGGAGSTDFPTLNPGRGTFFQGTNKALSNVFILEFDTTGVRKWATYYGGSNKSIAYSIQNVDNTVWVCGSTSFANDFPTLNSGCGYYENTTAGTFILQFDTVGVRKWATYYGTDVENDGSYTWSDGKNLFIAGDAEFHGYPMKNPGGGAYFDDTVQGAIENIYVGKFILPGNLTLTPDSNTSICRGDSVQLSAAGGITYKWSPPAGLSATNIPNPVASPTVTITYTVTAIDTGACGGIYSDSIHIVVENNNPNYITTSKDTSICAGASINLIATGGADYTWNNGNTTSSIAITNDNSTATYTVNINNPACKKDTNLKVTVTVFPLPHINVSGNELICQGDSLQLDVSGGTNYLWDNGNTTTTYNTGPIDAPKAVTITAYNSIGCPHDTTIAINPDILTLSACCNTLLAKGDDTILVAYGNTTKPYHWSPQVTCLNPPLCDSAKVSPTVTTTYTVTTTDSIGCQQERLVTIVVDIPCFNFTVPNVFTPDYPGPVGKNDVLYIKTRDINDWSISIYDRWGKEMYHSTNPNEYWNGNAKNGNKAPDGVYYYLIDAACQSTTYKKSGFVQLIR